MKITSVVRNIKFLNGYFKNCNLKTNLRFISFNNEKSINEEIEETINFKSTNVCSWVIESRLVSICCKYNNLPKDEKKKFLSTFAKRYGINHDKIYQLAKKIACIEPNNQNQLISRERALKEALTPPYHWFFARVGRLEYGVKFLVDLRANVLDLKSQFTKENNSTLALDQLDSTLKELIFLWFSVGFLKVERVTWQTSCDILQKVSEYEAIHPVRNWADLKHRVGPYRRCYIFTHPSMPRDPLVVLHTALCDSIPDTIKAIQDSENRIKAETQDKLVEDKTKIKAAIFYSIASTQVGLQGIELGNYLIKEVSKQVVTEFPMIEQLSSLSPIPNFRVWVLDRMKRDIHSVFTKFEQETIKNDLNYNSTLLATRDLYLDFKKIFNNSLWANNKKLTSTLKDPLLRLCAYYLYKEKRRNYALNNVANFHLRNGAVMWRINWLADPSPRGMGNSFGIMVNYRYFLNETECNSRNYIENYFIKASNSVVNLSKEAEQVLLTNNLTEKKFN